MTKRIIIGIDEVGRGALAGPVVLAAVSCSRPIRWAHPKLGRIRDSKKLTPRRREAWCAYLRSHPAIRFQISRVSPAVIDRINITRAANLAALRLYYRFVGGSQLLSVIARSPARSGTTKQSRDKHAARLLRSARNDAAEGQRFLALLDGGLRLPLHIHHRAITKGDERIPLIAAASIIAKVWRDRLMVRMAAAFPRYGFELHKGYGTRAHRRTLRRHGPSPIHRNTFLG